MNHNVINQHTDACWTAAVEAALKLLDLQLQASMSTYESLYHYVEENCCVRLAAGSRNGLSTWVAHHATEHDLIVLPTGEQIKPYLRTLNPRAQVVKADWPHYRGEVAPQRIYIDQASSLTPHQIRNIYRSTANNVEQRWFLLG